MNDSRLDSTPTHERPPSKIWCLLGLVLVTVGPNNLETSPKSAAPVQNATRPQLAHIFCRRSKNLRSAQEVRWQLCHDSLWLSLLVTGRLQDNQFSLD